jgi:hypothetical protein
LNFSDSFCLKETFSKERNSVADTFLMKPVDSSARIGNFPRSESISASDSWYCLVLGSSCCGCRCC